MWVNKASHQWLKNASKSANFKDDVIITEESSDWVGISQTRSNIIEVAIMKFSQQRIAIKNAKVNDEISPASLSCKSFDFLDS